MENIDSDLFIQADILEPVVNRQDGIFLGPPSVQWARHSTKGPPLSQQC